MEIEQWFWTVFFFFFGACWGSFANVMIVRIPAGESFVRPRSACRSCKTLIKWYQNIPIFSWIFLRGRCASCGAKFSIRYPIVELVMGLLFAAAFLVTGFNITLVERLLFIFAAVTASVIDIDHMILPDKFTLSGIVIGLVGAAVNPDRCFGDALLGVVLGGGSLWLVAYLYWIFRGREGMGGGDVKLLAWIGAVMGMWSVPIVVILSSLVGAVVGLGLSVRTKGGLSQIAIPFGPYLVAAALGYMFFDGLEWARWYFENHGLPLWSSCQAF